MFANNQYLLFRIYFGRISYILIYVYRVFRMYFEFYESCLKIPKLCRKKNIIYLSEISYDFIKSSEGPSSLTCLNRKCLNINWAKSSKISENNLGSNIFVFPNVCIHTVGCNNLHQWMKPERVSNDLLNKLNTCEIRKEPLGVVLVIGPWNYPVSTIFLPVISAVAAGMCDH